jgi:hypothetical protein
LNFSIRDFENSIRDLRISVRDLETSVRDLRISVRDFGRCGWPKTRNFQVCFGGERETGNYPKG